MYFIFSTVDPHSQEIKFGGKLLNKLNYDEILIKIKLFIPKGKYKLPSRSDEHMNASVIIIVLF